MKESTDRARRRGPVMLAELVGRILNPVTAKRGFATADLIAAWADIVGPRYAECTRPEKIVRPRGEALEGQPALLVLRVDGPRAVLVQHEAGQIAERVNAFLGYGAVGQIRIVQAPVKPKLKLLPAAAPPLDEQAEARLAEAVGKVADDNLRAALDRLGRGVLSEPAMPAGRSRETP